MEIPDKSGPNAHAPLEKIMLHFRSTVLLFLLGFLAIFDISTATRLAAADSQAEAVSTFAAANLVIGQSDFTSNQCDRGGAPATNNFSSPEGTLIMVGKKKRGRQRQ